MYSTEQSQVSAPSPWGRRLLALLLAASLLALGGAFVLENRFGVVGCVLCVYQRVPFVIAAVGAAAGIALWRSRLMQQFVLTLCGIAFVAGAGIAFYQVGLEQGWWMESSICTGSTPAVLGVLDLRAAIQSGTPRPPCDQVDWSLFGVSLATFNVLFSSGLALLCAVGLALTGSRRSAAT
jgi:disulfide bond formation protein DsbB